MLQRKLPFPLGSSNPYVVVGIVFYLVVLAVGVGASCFFVALETTRPTIISQDGIAVGAATTALSTKIHSLGEITRITCNLAPRENRIRRPQVYSDDSEVGLGSARVTLESVLAIATIRAPRDTIRPCEHGALEHWWSY
jgi:hypothetical protein